MDTLMALRHAKEQKARVLAICNTNGSTIPRESDAVLYTHGGPEIAVASTKAFLTQLVACYLIGLHLAQIRGVMYADEVAAVVSRLRRVPDNLRDLLGGMEEVRALARDLSTASTVLFIGRHVGSRWRWRARSSSRNSPTCTPRASPRASSSTARSR